MTKTSHWASKTSCKTPQGWNLCNNAIIKGLRSTQVTSFRYISQISQIKKQIYQIQMQIQIQIFQIQIRVIIFYQIQIRHQIFYQIQIQIRRICFWICICRYRYVSEPNPGRSHNMLLIYQSYFCRWPAGSNCPGV